MKLYFKIVGAFVLLGLLHACTKQDYEGPPLGDFFGTFSIVDSLVLSNLSPDFAGGEEVGFSCKFSKNVDWKITITGLTSSSRKEILGFSSEIDSNVTRWNGNTTEVPFFGIEECEVQLTFPGRADTLIESVSIQSSKVFSGISVAIFEGELPEGTLVFKQLGGNMTFEIANDDPVEGNSYYKMGGKVGFDWVVGQIDIPIDLSAVSSSPENFFLTLGILSGDDNGEFATNQYIKILISESDMPFNDDTSNNGADVFQNDMEVYQYKIQPVDWAGWEYANVSYSMFEEKNADNSSVVYDRNPSDITAIRIQCQCCPWNSSIACPENEFIDARTDIDFVIFTENSSLLDQ